MQVTKKQIHLAMAAVLLPAMAFAETAQNTYVRPAGGNTPQSPYDSWANAANEMRTAADVTATHGVVTIASGDYSGDAKCMTPEQAVEMRIVDAVDGTEPGSITVKKPFCAMAHANTDPDKYSLTVSKGTVTTSGTSGNVFSDGTGEGGTAGAATHFKMTLTGTDAYLDLTGKDFYWGYNTRDTTLRLSNSAKLKAAHLFIGWTSATPVASQVIVDSGAKITADKGNGTGTIRIGNAPTDCSLTVSNATTWAYYYYVGKSGETHRSRVTLAGESPRLTANTGFCLYGDSTLEFNVSEAPMAGFDKTYTMAYVASLSADATARIELSGLEQLRTRIRAAGKKTFSTRLLSQYSGKTIALPDDTLVAFQASAAAVPGFTAGISGAYLVLNYTEQGLETTYVVPAGTEGTVPAYPYWNWGTAANTILDAVQATMANGTSYLTNGVYATDDKLVDSRAVNLQAVDYGKPNDAGEATVGYIFFWQAIANPTDDPGVNAVTLSKGTFKCTGSNDGVFADYVSGGDGTLANARLTVAGPDSVLDTLSKPFYVGFSMRGIRATVADNAQLKTGRIYIGLTNSGSDSGLSVVDGGKVSDEGNVRIGEACDGCYVVVSNGTLNTVNCSLGKSGVTRNTTMTIAGATPSVTSAWEFYAYNGTTQRFNVAEAPFTGYATTPFKGRKVEFAEGSNLSVVGAQALLNRMKEAGKSRYTLTLIEASESLTISDAQLAAAQDQLPKYAELSVKDNKLLLRVGKPRGLIVRIW